MHADLRVVDAAAGFEALQLDSLLSHTRAQTSTASRGEPIYSKCLSIVERS